MFTLFYPGLGTEIKMNIENRVLNIDINFGIRKYIFETRALLCKPIGISHLDYLKGILVHYFYFE